MYMRITCYVCCLVCLLAACQRPEDEASSMSDAAARIGTVTITQQDVENAWSLLDNTDRAFANTSIGRQNLVQILVREKLILQDARNNGLDQDPSYLKALAQKHYR